MPLSEIKENEVKGSVHDVIFGPPGDALCKAESFRHPRMEIFVNPKLNHDLEAEVKPLATTYYIVTKDGIISIPPNYTYPCDIVGNGNPNKNGHK